MNGNEQHYYLHKDRRYENMRQLREALGITSRAFRCKVKDGEIQKITNSQHGHYESTEQKKKG